MKIIATDRFRHDGATYEPGEHDVAPTLAGYFISVGWASDKDGNTGPPKATNAVVKPDSVSHGHSSS